MSIRRWTRAAVSGAVLAAAVAGAAVPQDGLAVPEDTPPAVETPGEDFEVETPSEPSSDPAAPVVFNSVLDLSQEASDYNPRLRGGQDAKPGQWPASLRMRYRAADGRLHHCTAAMIGPSVMLTAAHCVPATGLIALDRPGADDWAGVCERHPAYGVGAVPRDVSADFALCRLSRPYPLPRGERYETVSHLPMNQFVGTKDNFILLTGYGCTGESARGDQTSDGKYRIGYALIDESSASATRTRPDATLYAASQQNNLFTRYDAGQTHANLCEGDSGGPAFSLTGNEVTNRTIIAVNSRALKSRSIYTGSLLSATGGAHFRPWAVRWLEDQGLEACGLRGRPACR